MPQYSVSFLTPAEVEQSPAVLAAWENLLDRSTNLYCLNQSPEWWNNLCSVHSGLQCSLGVVRDGNRTIAGVVPLQIGQHALYFPLGKRNLWRTQIRTIFLLGSQPLLPDDDNAYHQLFSSLWDSFSDCNGIYLTSVVKDSWCWRYFEAAKARSEKTFFLYAEEGVRQFHTITVPPNFEIYLKKFSAKRRNGHRRDVKILRERGGGDLQLERIENREQIDRFFSVARPLFGRSWQGKSLRSCLDDGKPQFEYLAQSGILRSYLLRCGDTYFAYEIGYQFRDVFHLIETVYDPAFSEYSPGKVLLWLVIEDLTNHAPPEKISLGHGDLDYKAHFATDHTEDTSILLMRTTLANRFRCGCHQTFRSSVRAIKRYLGRNTPT